MSVQAELVAIGSELVLGQIVDTNTSFMAKRLAEIGIEIVRTPRWRRDGADGRRLAGGHPALPIVITTGGIGPTEDDLTARRSPNVTGRPLPSSRTSWSRSGPSSSGEDSRWPRTTGCRPSSRRIHRHREIEGDRPGFIVEGKDIAPSRSPAFPRRCSSSWTPR